MGNPLTTPVPSIGSLTSLRFFAAMAIVVEHSRGTLLPVNYLARFPLDAGVTFFYVLSGFILTYVHADGIDGMNRRSFYEARFARIWPATMLSLVVLLVLVPSSMYLPLWIHWSPIATAPAFLSFVTMTQAWVPIPAYYFGFNAVAWSISVEMAFYLAFPFLLRSIRRTWWWKLALVIAAGLGLLLLSIRLGLPPFRADALGHVTAHGISYVNPIVRLKEFFVGVLLGALFIRLPGRRRSTIRWTALEVAVLTSSWLVLPRISAYRYHWLRISNESLGMWTDQSLDALLFGTVILVFAFNSGVVSRVLSLRPLVLLGDISFSVYLLHTTFLAWYRRHASLDWLPTQHRFALLVLVTCLAAYLSWRLVESPARRSLRARFARRAARREARREARQLESPGASGILAAP